MSPELDKMHRRTFISRFQIRRVWCWMLSVLRFAAPFMVALQLTNGLLVVAVSHASHANMAAPMEQTIQDHTSGHDHGLAGSNATCQHGHECQTVNANLFTSFAPRFFAATPAHYPASHVANISWVTDLPTPPPRLVVI